VAQGAQMLAPFLQDFVEQVGPEAKERIDEMQPGTSEQLEQLRQNPEAVEQLQQVDSDDFQRLLEQLQEQQQGTGQ